MATDFSRLSALPLVETGRATPKRAKISSVIRELLDHRELMGLLVRRELKARYKDSSLGFLWTLMRPLALLLVYFVAIGQFLGAARAIPDFGIFVFTGLTLWALYSEIISASTVSILGNSGLIKKVYLPREIFPLAAAGSTFVNFFIQLGVLLVVVIASGRLAVSLNLLYIPAAILLAALWAIAIGILLSAVNVYLRDTQYLVDIAIMLLFWASPIVYSWSFVVDAANRLAMPWIESIVLANPITVAILAFQKGVWAAGSETSRLGEAVIPPQPWPASLDAHLLVMFVLGVVALFIAQRVFHRLQGNFAQEI